MDFCKASPPRYTKPADNCLFSMAKISRKQTKTVENGWPYVL